MPLRPPQPASDDEGSSSYVEYPHITSEEAAGPDISTSSEEEGRSSGSRTLGVGSGGVAADASTATATTTASPSLSSRPVRPVRRSADPDGFRAPGPAPGTVQAREAARHRRFSPETLDRATAAKFAIELYYEQLERGRLERAARLAALQREQAEARVSVDEAAAQRDRLVAQETEFLRLRRLRISTKSFDQLKVIGKGAFGTVSLVQMRGTQDVFAMKQMNKGDIVAREQIDHVRAERDILAASESPEVLARRALATEDSWLTKLHFSFQDEMSLYLVMEYVPGGDLMGLLVRVDTLTEPQARFYAAEIVLALEAVHKLDYIHRDVKPDNFLIGADGHLKLSDFGLCVAAETLVVRADGTARPIGLQDGAARGGDYVATGRVDHAHAPVGVAGIVATGRRRLLAMRTGAETLRVTPDHQLAVTYGEARTATAPVTFLPASEIEARQHWLVHSLVTYATDRRPQADLPPPAVLAAARLAGFDLGRSLCPSADHFRSPLDEAARARDKQLAQSLDGTQFLSDRTAAREFTAALLPFLVQRRHAPLSTNVPRQHIVRQLGLLDEFVHEVVKKAERCEGVEGAVAGAEEEETRRRKAGDVGRLVRRLVATKVRAADYPIATWATLGLARKSARQLRGWATYLGFRYASSTLGPRLALAHLTAAADLTLSPAEQHDALRRGFVSLPLLSVTRSDEAEAVFDLEVPATATFASASGCLVHNCTGLATVQARDVLKRLKAESTELRDGDLSFSSKARAQAALTWRRNRRFHAKSTVGTPDYIAPEVFAGQAYDERVDWWSAGCILYEMLVGYPPFAAESPAETYRKIVNHRVTLAWPRDSGPTRSVVDLVARLCCDYEDRLPLAAIKEHPWFTGVEWGAVRKSRAVFVPQLSSPADTCYFDEQAETEPPPTLATVFPPPPSALLSPRPSDARHRRHKDPVAARWSTTHLSFVGFTYRAFPQKVRRDDK